MPIIDVPEVLREKLGAEGARALVDILNQAGRETRDEAISLAEERFGRRLADELAKLRQDLAALEIRVTERLSGAQTGFEGRIAAAQTAFESRIAAAETSFESRIAAAQTSFERRIAEAQTSFEIGISKAQTRLIQWSFVFWASLMAALFLRT